VLPIRCARQAGVDAQRLVAGSRRNSVNPNTGQAEFNDPQLPPGMEIPPGGSLSNNIQQAEDSWNPFWFYNQVRNRKDQEDYKWDYKQGGSQYEDFGNFNYGATGTAFGFPEGILKRGAGWAQGQSGNKTSGHWWGSAPYGDDLHDQEMIQKGIDYYKNGGR
jgi:hypothetical protein